MGGQTHPFTDVMVFEELPVVEETTVVVKKAIKKSEARTQLTAAKKAKAKKAKAKKAAKKPKAKKAKKKKKKKKKAKKKKKKRKKKKAKKVRFPGGKRRKGQHKSKAMKAAGKKSAAAMKKKGSGLFKPVSQSAALAKVTGISGKASRVAITKAVGVHQEEGAEQGPQRRQDRGRLRRRLHVQARGRCGQAREVSGCVFRSPVISTPGSRGC